MRYRFTRRALQHIEQITYFIALDKPGAADRVYERIVETCALVADMPNIGRNPSYITDPEMLSVPVKQYSNYLVFYRKRKKEVIITAVVDGRRNLPDVFNQD